MLITSRRVLVIDDDQAICDLLLDLLIEEGYDARTAHDGAAALAVLPLWRPDLILLDLHMPDLNGWEFRRQQRPTFPAIPVLVLTADCHAQEQGEQLVAPVMLKPFNLDELLNAIEQLTRTIER